MSNHHDKSNGSFTGGFAIGLFAGAVGYFLFATDKGKKVRVELEQEWQVAKQKLADEGVIESSQTTFKDLILSGLSSIAGQDWQPKKTTKAKSSKKTSKKKAPAKKSASSASKAKKFKNT